MGGYIGSKASVVSSGAERKQTYAITTTTTSLTGLAYTPTKVHVYHNGIRLVDGTDYTATNGTSITLTNAAENGDEVVVISYATFQTSDTVSAANGGTFAGNVNFEGNVGIGQTSPTRNLVISDSSQANIALQTSTSGSTLTDGFQLQADSSNAYVWNYENTNILFGTNNTERMRILAGGGLTFNGDTAAANALDDYEEGTWDVVYSGDSGSDITRTDNGKYIKIGRMVYISFYSYAGSNPTVPSGNCYVSLPFAADTSGHFSYMHIIMAYAGGLSFNTINASSSRRWQINDSTKLTSYRGQWASSPSYYELSGAGCYIAAS